MNGVVFRTRVSWITSLLHARTLLLSVLSPSVVSLVFSLCVWYCSPPSPEEASAAGKSIKFIQEQL